MREKNRNRLTIFLVLFLFYSFFGIWIIAAYYGCVVFLTCGYPGGRPYIETHSVEEVEFIGWFEITTLIIVLLLFHISAYKLSKKREKRPIEAKIMEEFRLNKILREIVENHIEIKTIKDIIILRNVISTFSVREVELMRKQLVSKPDMIDFLKTLNPDI